MIVVLSRVKRSKPKLGDPIEFLFSHNFFRKKKKNQCVFHVILVEKRIRKFDAAYFGFLVISTKEKK